MGQRLDRPTSSNPSASGTNAVATSLSTTFSSSSASSTSSTSSNTSAATTTNAANLVNIPRTTNSNSSSHRHHRHRHHRSSGQSAPENNQASSVTSGTTSSSEMSPRTRFRTEMTRRGYTTNSSDLFFRLFQFPPQSQAASTPATANIENLPATPSTNGTSSSGTGLSAFRFFNLGAGSSSATNNDDLDSDHSSDEDEPHWNHNMSSLASSLPLFFSVRDFKCFVCSKQIPADDVEAHIMMCLTKPRLTYNDDVLTDNKGECIICFEELEKGQTIARLPCLCIYHKHCIENWLQRSQSCPGHPPD